MTQPEEEVEMSARVDNTGEPFGQGEDNTFALHGLLAYGAVLLLCIFPGSWLQLWNPTLGLIITEVAFIALPAGIVLFVHRGTQGGKLFALPQPGKSVLTMLIGGCATVIAVQQGIAARKALAGIDTAGADVTARIPLISLVLLAPFCEELLFRPVIQNGLARHWSNRASVLLTALLFALFHLQLLRFPETFVIGIFAGVVFLKTRNVWYSVIVHAICNSLGPVLWRWAPHLDLLVNRVTVIGLACLALAVCYHLGEKAPATLTGVWHRLSWAVFGSPESFRAAQRSRLVAPVMWGLVLPLMALLGYGHAVMVHHQGREQIKASYVVSEKDTWTVLSDGEIRASSDLFIRRFPEKYEDLVLQLPFQEAALREVTFLNGALPFSRAAKGEYAVDLSSCRDAGGSCAITVQWSFPPNSLTPDAKWGYRTPLKSLAPSDSLSITVTVAEGSGFRFIGGNGVRTRHPFSGSSRTPQIDYGSCGLSMEREPEAGGKHPSSAPR